MKMGRELDITHYVLTHAVERASNLQEAMDLSERARRGLRQVDTPSKLVQTHIDLMEALLDLTEFQFRLAAVPDTGKMCADLTRIRHRLVAVSSSLRQIEGAI